MEGGETIPSEESESHCLHFIFTLFLSHELQRFSYNICGLEHSVCRSVCYERGLDPWPINSAMLQINRYMPSLVPPQTIQRGRTKTLTFHVTL
jgi:hypothetical protein